MRTELRGDTLRPVLSHLTEDQDLVRCTAVNKAWAAACTWPQPRAIRLVQRERASPVDHMQVAVQQLRWLQSLQRTGRLQNLQEARLLLLCDQPIDPTPLAHGFGMVAGLHHLCRCEIQGAYCLAAVLSLLPTSLVRLDLWPETGPNFICLSSFQQFTHLQWLRLGVGIDNPIDKDDLHRPMYTLVVDTVMVCLKTLVIHDELQCMLRPGCSILHCLPNVCHFSVRITADLQGVQLAKRSLLLPSLAKLRLNLLKSQDVQLTTCTLVVPKQSIIAELDLNSPERPSVRLSLGKGDILLSCQGTYVYTTNRPSDFWNF